MPPLKNEQQQSHHARRKPGIMFIGKKIWISELASIVFMFILLVALLSISLVILRNELSIRNLDHAIADLKSENINKANEIDGLRERLRLITLLSAVVGDRVKPAALYKLADLVYDNSRLYGYNPELLLAVIAVESKFNPEALGRYRSGGLSGALGLMQIKYPTALAISKMLGIKGLKPKDLMDPETNIILGTAYLTTLISRFKSFKLGIIAYNLGPGTVRSTLSRKEALPMRYYEKVLKQYYLLQKIGEDLEKEELASN